MLTIVQQAFSVKRTTIQEGFKPSHFSQEPCMKLRTRLFFALVLFDASLSESKVIQN